MSVLFPFIMIIIIDGISTFDYITNSGESFSLLADKLGALAAADYIIIGAGFLGTIVSGITIKFLRKSGYRMF